jgi:hypothetical protein
VVPVSAALSRTLDRMSADGDAALVRVIDLARRIPEAQLDVLLQSQELFCDYDLEGCGVPSAERRRLWRDLDCPWRVFVTILNEAQRDRPPGEITACLRDIAGFEALRRTLHDHFLERSEILRCHRIVRDARALMRQLWFDEVLPQQRDSRTERARLERFVTFVDAAPGDGDVARELSAFLRARLDDAEHATRLESAWKRVDVRLSRLERSLGEHNADFAALQELAAEPSSFSKEETEELRTLLGIYGTDASSRLGGHPDFDRSLELQLRWRLIRDRALRGSPRWAVADRVHARLGLVLDELRSDAGGSSLAVA